MGTTSIDDWSKLKKDKRKWYTGMFWKMFKIIRLKKIDY